MDEKNNIEIIGAQVYAVLKNLPETDYKKISEKERKIYERFKEQSEQIQIDLNKNLKEQNISKDAMDIIYSIVIRYLLTEEERKKVIKKLKENDKFLQKNNYIQKDLFKNKQSNVNEEQSKNMLVKVRNKNFIERIFEKIKNIFKRLSF